jgi:hypothetical protein
MPWRLALAATALSLVAALTGCGSSADTLDRDTAMQHSMNAVAGEVGDDSSDLYHHRIQLLGATAFGKGGWLVRVADRTAGGTICVVDLPEHSSLGTVENIDVIPCKVSQGPARPAATPPASA